VTDLQIEKQVLIPQVKIHLDYEQAPRATAWLPAICCAPGTDDRGRAITQIIEGNRRFDLLVRLPESARDPQALAEL
jgi:HME family heavy-metal exporter